MIVDRNTNLHIVFEGLQDLVVLIGILFLSR